MAKTAYQGDAMSGCLGIVDWGIGGLGFYQLIRRNTDIPVIYFSDSGHTPYGKTPTPVLHDRLHTIFQHLFSIGASRVAIACNAASAAYDDTDTVNGIINHGVRMLKNADPDWKSLGLLAGRGTVYSKVFPRRLGPHDFQLRQRVSQPLSAHIEAGRLTGPQLHADLKNIMSPLRRCDALMLACTHYPAIAGELAPYISRDCKILDPAEEMANWITTNWKFARKNGPDRWLTSGQPDQLKTNGKAAFGVDVGEVETVRLA